VYTFIAVIYLRCLHYAHWRDALCLCAISFLNKDIELSIVTTAIYIANEKVYNGTFLYLSRDEAL
jgi:hypothetical protein